MEITKIEITEEDIKDAFIFYLSCWKDDPKGFEEITINTDAEQYGEDIAPFFFDILKEIKNETNL